ncbi:PrpF family protein [Paracoccus sp. TK19116]|uniref:PrpF family protein n=1 Tax=Paracoccus albicereus TaxID=2922394 RepID=A0ABT1MUU9_9RHOB|nr:PrpF domain-containing protein [Paracoccus albicereus]MCQ0972100.1 PrpF family protein [Paracoccus albicereus]
MTTGSARQLRIPAVFMRGGTSNAIIFHADDLPADMDERHRIFLRAIGSPDPGRRQLDGLGGGVSSLSKICVIAPSTRPDADVDYTFVQIPVTTDRPDYSANCGNMSSAIGPFAVEEGLVQTADGEAVVRIHNTNTSKIIESRFQVRDGVPLVEGDFVNPGVAGTGSAIQLDFLSPGGAATGRLLPTGRELDRLEDASLDGVIEASLVDATNAVVFIPARTVGLTGYETPDEIEARGDLMQRLEAIRRVASVRMGLAADTDAAARLAGSPKIAMIAAPQDYVSTAGETIGAADFDIAVRMISMGQAHRAVTLTGAMCTAVASGIAGSCVAETVRANADGMVRIGHSSGVMPVKASVSRADAGWKVERATVFRTARRLMEGSVLVPVPTKND